MYVRGLKPFVLERSIMVVSRLASENARDPNVGSPCAFYLFIRQPMGRKSALRREIPWILRGFQGRLSC